MQDEEKRPSLTEMWDNRDEEGVRDYFDEDPLGYTDEVVRIAEANVHGPMHTPPEHDPRLKDTSRKGDMERVLSRRSKERKALYGSGSDLVPTIPDGKPSENVNW